jgi:hypothetical protein
VQRGSACSRFVMRVRTRTVHHHHWWTVAPNQRRSPTSPPPLPAFAGYCSGAQTLFAHNRLLARTIVSSSRHNNVSIHLSFPKSRFRRSCGARCSSLVKVSSSSLAFMMVDCSYAIRVHKLPSYSSAHSLDSTRTESLTCLISRINYG